MTIVKKGQSTLEYIILVTGVIIVILTFVGKSDGVFQSSLTKTLNDTSSHMPAIVNTWKAPSTNASSF